MSSIWKILLPTIGCTIHPVGCQGGNGDGCGILASASVFDPPKHGREGCSHSCLGRGGLMAAAQWQLLLSCVPWGPACEK
jgi:hypothetical protein